MGVRRIRTHSRHVVDASVIVEARNRELTVVGELVDLGEGGAACRLEAPLRMGEPVTLRLKCEPPIVLSAEVAWVAWGESSSVRLGLRFADGQDALVNQLLEQLTAAGKVGT